MSLPNKTSTSRLSFVILKVLLFCQRVKNLFQSFSNTAGVFVISLERQRTWSEYRVSIFLNYSYCCRRQSVYVILSQKNELVRYIRFKKPYAAPEVKQHIIKSIIIWSIWRDWATSQLLWSPLQPMQDPPFISNFTLPSLWCEQSSGL